MKVTVNFGDVRVIVPCGRGDILVRELMELAITRYKKATGKCASSVVRIHNLKSSRDDGILYPEDQLNDVADDREQIIAVYEEGFLPFGCADVTSTTSSVCTGSPDLFSVEVLSPLSYSDAETDEHGLQVRRGSEPALNCLFPPADDPVKRWSTAVVITADPSHEDSLDPDSGMSSPRLGSVLDGDLLLPPNKYSDENAFIKTGSVELGVDAALDSDASSGTEERRSTVVLQNESGPLGIHVVPDFDGSGRDSGLVIQSIEAGGRIDRDGRFRVGDRIVEINGRSLRDVGFQSAQEIFKGALRATHIRLQLARGGGGGGAPRKPPPPVYPKGEEALVEGEERAGGVSTRVATVTPTKKMPAGATPGRRWLSSANTRRIGRRLDLELVKGAGGLGFSVTTRDNPAGGLSPVYIKNVLPSGAAIEDGRLRPGDRLLEVDGVSMTGKSQDEAVAILRNVPYGATARLIVSRQEEGPDEHAGVFPWKQREILTFQIPLGAGGGGLGVSVKGKSTASLDLGIFVKAVIPGGAAAADGRLHVDDQLVNVNGISLLGVANGDAMDALRRAMGQAAEEGPIRDAIILTVARRMPDEEDADEAPPPPPPLLLRDRNPVAERLTSSPTPAQNGVAAPHAESKLSLEDPDAGFARDGFGRQSMSEKRHAQLDARNTDTYQRNKKARQERDRLRRSFEPQEQASEDGEGGAAPPAPFTVLRKSGSLESLQTMIQALNEGERHTAPRSRGCNESFRAAVDRSYEAPAAMDTLDEESESGSAVLGGGSRVADPFSAEFVDAYCQGNKAKKKSLLKGLGAVFKFSKNRKQPDEPVPQEPDSTAESRAVLPIVPNRQERMQSLREQHQRMHQRRQGHYPLEHREEFYESELREVESRYAMLPEYVHARSHSLDVHHHRDTNANSHYVNYREIRQHMGDLHSNSLHPFNVPVSKV